MLLPNLCSLRERSNAELDGATSPCARLSRARSTTAALPHPRLRQASRLSPPRPPGVRAARGTHADGSRVHCCPIDGLGTRLYPCGIATATPQTFTVASRPRRNRPSREFPRPLAAGGARAAAQPESAGLELVTDQEA